MFVDNFTISGAVMALAVAIVVFYLLNQDRSSSDQD
jgi:hypothetical protein